MTAKPSIVSLLASATEIAVELGLADSIVGISHECDYPEEIFDRPRVSSPRFDPAGKDSGTVDRMLR
ncbi:MAG: cobalamin-binding protein, partial [Gemmatimonadales bacterium]